MKPAETGVAERNVALPVKWEGNGTQRRLLKPVPTLRHETESSVSVEGSAEVDSANRENGCWHSTTVPPCD
jgi:hypothetical protein